MDLSLLPLKLKIITGYVTLVLLVLILLSLIYIENVRLSTIDKSARIILVQKGQIETITLQILEITQLSEQVVAWKNEDYAFYREKQCKLMVQLQKLQKQITDKNQQKRITTILNLLTTKNDLTLAILADLKELQSSHDLLNKSIPKIIQQAKQERRHLAEQIRLSYKKSEEKGGGFLGLFRNKKKIRSQAEAENEAILQKNQLRTDTMLRRFTDDIRFASQKQNSNLLAHVDSLSKQSALISREISQLVSAVNITEQKQERERTKAYLLGEKKSSQLVFALGIGTMLFAILFYFFLRHDLKKRYRYRIQLEKLNQQNEELLRSRKNMMLTVSHDLRAPLTSIRGCAELIIDERSKEKRAQLCETILQSSDSMTALLNALLNFHRLDTGKELSSRTPFRLKSLVETLNSEFSPIAYKVGLQYTVEYSDSDIVVVGDRERLTQIARNLLSNAIKFTTEGKVRLKLRHREGILDIEVSDTGTGMTHEQTKRIFQPFERLENAETRDGFGLGLAITQGLVGLLNGAIVVDSEPGKGSTFIVRIPLPIAEEQHLKKAPVPYYKLPSGLKILAIDDDAVLLKMTEDMLTRNRVRCDTCQDVQELTARMREQKYDLLITDIRMPKISGFDLLELLRSSDIGTSRTIPVLALTARADYNEADFTALGFAGCLYKPFSMAELLLAVQSCIGKQMKESPLQADFTELLSGEQNNKGMLELLIRETEKDMKALKESMEKEDRHSMLELLHHLLPLWEIVRVNSPLDDLCRILAENTDINGNEVRLGVNKVIETGKQLTLQASKQVKEEGYV